MDNEDILSSDGTIMATSVEVHSLHADPSKLSKDTAKVLAQAVAPMLDLDARDTEKRLNRRNRRDVRAGKNLVPGQLNAIKDRVEALSEDHPSLRGALFSRNEYDASTPQVQTRRRCSDWGKPAPGVRVWEH